MLAWRRTLLALSAVALLGGRLAYYAGAFAALFAVVALWGAVVLVGWWRMRALLGSPVAPARTIAVTGLCTFLVALAGAVLVLS